MSKDTTMPQPLQQSSGDILADRRWSMAEAYLADGDAAAAADLLRQAVQMAPGWSAGWFRLGEVLEERLTDQAGAAEAFRAAALHDPEDVLGAAVRLGRLVPEDPASRMSPAYVAKLFDQYAPRFDAHLTQSLGYRGPEIIMATLTEVCARKNRPVHFTSALDLGCGTGLMARAIRAHVGVINGVDLSPEMVRLAKETGLYRQVWVGDVVEAVALAAHPLVLAADVLCYIKDLTQLFRAVAQAIPPSGLFAFTCQSNGQPGVALGADMRFSHAPDYLRETATAAGLAILNLAPCVTRKDRGEDVLGHVAVLGRA
jgi:predicted TPR repeat methyltransferase